MRVSVIIAVYKDVESLSLIITALKRQTYKNFEVIIAEDGENPQMREYVASITGLDVKHTTQEDIGVRKTRSLNNGIIASSGEYLIFIDGDCIPYTTFVEGHVKLSDKNSVLTGRRVNLGSKYSSFLRNQSYSSWNLEISFVWHFFNIVKDSQERHAEEGFYFNPDGMIYKYLISKRKSSVTLLGCNYSCFKEALIAINGYDEGYGETAIGDDTDLEWRFKGIGLELKSCRNVANIFHLFHSRSFRNSISYDDAFKKFDFNKSTLKFFCDEGLSSH